MYRLQIGIIIPIVAITNTNITEFIIYKFAENIKCQTNIICRQNRIVVYRSILLYQYYYTSYCYYQYYWINLWSVAYTAFCSWNRLRHIYELIASENERRR